MRSFTFGRVRQLDAVIAAAIGRAWSIGAGPKVAPVTIDLDSTSVEVYGEHNQGAAYDYTKVLGYHPILTTRGDTDELLHARLRKGSSQRGTKRSCEELVARVPRCGACGPLTLRADAGFFSWDLVGILTRFRCRFSITVAPNTQVRGAIASIEEDRWRNIVYPDGASAQVAETTYATVVRQP